jgi:hypothetical protein
MVFVKKKMWLLRWQSRLAVTPFSLFLSLALVPVGITAAVLGSEVSKAITNVLPGEPIPHVWGVLLAAAGATTLFGIGRNSWLGEYVGLQLMSFGLLFYAVCCYIGLGIGGIVSGSFALAYTVACWYRSRKLYEDAKISAQEHHDESAASARASSASADRSSVSAEESKQSAQEASDSADRSEDAANRGDRRTDG